MASVRFTATRSLYGASASESVTFELPIRYAGMTIAKKVMGTTRVSMGGLRERYHERVDRIYTFATKPMAEPLYKRLRMFLDSVEREESFLFSPDTSAYSTAYLADLDYDEALDASLDSLRTVGFSIVVST